MGIWMGSMWRASRLVDVGGVQCGGVYVWSVGGAPCGRPSRSEVNVGGIEVGIYRCSDVGGAQPRVVGCVLQPGM